MPSYNALRPVTGTELSHALNSYDGSLNLDYSKSGSGLAEFDSVNMELFDIESIISEELTNSYQNEVWYKNSLNCQNNVNRLLHSTVYSSSQNSLLFEKEATFLNNMVSNFFNHVRFFFFFFFFFFF